MPEKSVRVILLGGTIDSKSYKYDEEFQQTGESPDFVDPLATSTVKRYLNYKKYPMECSLIRLTDSQNIGDDDMNKLMTLITDTPQPLKVVVMGTDALAQRAREVAARLGPYNDKTVLFVGAMEPLSHGIQSDGYGNLDFVMDAARSESLPPGAYVAMPDRQGQHRVFHADDALRKETGTGRVRQGGRQHKYFVGNTVDIALPATPLWR